MNDIAAKVKEAFKEKYKQEPHLYYSPGRINLIGEHIDYNDGFVMPGAIDKGIYFAISLNNSNQLNFYAVDFKQSISISLSEVRKMNSWKNYVLGVVNEFQKLNLPLKGFNCAFGGNIPIGAGMSSSAALEGGVAFAVNELCNFGLSRKELALLCQRAEHNFPGVMCGIMDQYASIMGKKNTVLLLDCMNITHENIPLNIEGYKIVLVNSKVHHSLASSEYNVRRKQCEEGLRILKKEMQVNSFRDIKNSDELLPYKGKMNEKVFDRCKFVVEEIKRTQEAATLLKQNKLEEFGKLMFATHEGLSKLYEVSCKELDFLVARAAENKNVIGSRLMGGGFGGCSINIIKENSVKDFLSQILPAYKKQFNIDAEHYEVNIENGTDEL